MPRRNTDQPSSGEPFTLYIPTATNNGFVNTTWTTLAEAPDFSVPASGDDGATPDPANTDRELRPGEVFLETPLTVVNTTATTRWVELQMILQGPSTQFPSSGQTLPVTSQVPVPAGETIYLPIQGLRLLKDDFTSTTGHRLQIRAEVNNALKVIGAAVELEMSTHAPDSEAP